MKSPDQTWKLLIYRQINHQLLFNLEDDPYEMNYLSHTPKHADRLLKMEKTVKRMKKAFK